MKKTFSKKLLAFLLSVLMVVTSVPLVAIAATGDTGTLDPVTSLICNDSSRPHTRSNLAILNDGAEGNTSVGVLKYTLPNVPAFKNANLGVTFTFPGSSTFKNNPNYTLDIYFIDLSKTGYNNVSNNSINSFWSGMSFGDNAVSNIKSKLGLSDSNKIGSYAYSQLTQGVTVDLTNAANTALESSYGSFGLIFINSGVGGKGSNGWSDIYCNIGTFSYTEGDDVSASDLAAVISKYETKMNGTVYTNMKSAYEAYIAARKIQDGYVKEGDANYASTLQLAQTLLAKTNAMQQYSKPATVSVSGVNSEYTQNLLSTPTYNNFTNSNTVTQSAASMSIGVSFSNVVWLDDGTTTMTAPIMAKLQGIGLSNSTFRAPYQLFKYSGSDFTSSDVYFSRKWLDNTTTNAYVNYSSSTSAVGYSGNGNDTSTGAYGLTDNNARYVSNYLSYNSGSSFTDNYGYSKQLSVKFDCYIKDKGNWRSQSSANNGRGVHYNNNTYNDIYVINYNKVKTDGLFKSDNLNKLKNITNYTASSALAFLNAYDSLTSRNYQISTNGVSQLCYDLNTDVNNLNSSASALKELQELKGVKSYLENEDYKKIAENGISVDSQKYTYRAYINFKNSYDALKSYYDGFDNKFDCSKENYNSVGLPKAQALFTTYDALKTAKPATDYSAYDKLIEAVKQQDMNAFTESYIKSDSSVYGLIGQYGTSAASITFNNGVANGVTETTSTDGTASTAYVNVNGTVWKNATQTELDHYVGTVKSALTEALGDTTGAKRNAYTVTVTEYTNDVAGTPVKTQKYFGDNFSVAGLDSTVAKIVVNGKEFPATDSFTARIQSNTDIKVYKTDNASLAEKKAVQVQDIYGKSAQAYYLDSNATVVFNGNQFTSGSASYQAQEIGSYAFVKWQVNGKDVAPGATMSVSEIKTIKPVYKVSTEKTYNVTLDETAVEAVNTKNIYYDSKVVVKPAEGAVAIAAKIGNAYYVVNYGAGEYTFYGCGDVNLYSVMPSGNGYTVKGESLDAATAEKVKEQKPFVWSVKDDNGTKLTTYSTFSNGTKIIEAGTMYYVSETAPSEESFKLGNTGVRSVAAKNPNAESSQYWLGITYGSKKLYTRAYVKYEATVNGTTVQVIDYGNIVSNEK